MKQIYYYILPIIIVGFIIFLATSNSITNNAVANAEPEPLLLQGHDSVDFGNNEEGTITFRGNFNPELLGLNIESLPSHIIIFTSERLEGIRIIYNFQDKTLSAGSPIMKTQELNLLDNKIHEVAYSFKDGIGQKLFVDGKEVASGEYNKPKRVVITAFAASDYANYQETNMDSTIESSETAMGFN